MSKQQGPSSFDILNQTEVGHTSNPRNGSGVIPSSGGNDMMSYAVGEFQLPGKEGLHILNASMDEMAAGLSAEGGALGASITNQVAKVTGHLVTEEAKGKDAPALTDVGAAEIQNANVANLTSEGRAKAASFRGGGAEMGG